MDNIRRRRGSLFKTTFQVGQRKTSKIPEYTSMLYLWMFRFTNNESLTLCKFLCLRQTKIDTALFVGYGITNSILHYKFELLDIFFSKNRETLQNTQTHEYLYWYIPICTSGWQYCSQDTPYILPKGILCSTKREIKRIKPWHASIRCTQETTG